MAQFKYKLKEVKVGDVDIQGGTKYTVTSIDPESGAVEWSVEKVADYESAYETLHKSKELFDSLIKSPGAKDDFKIRQIATQVRDAVNNYRTHLRKNYPEEYNKVKSLSEMSSTGGGPGNATFTSGTEGENYATKYAFRKKVKEDKGITPGPGPKAGPEGVTKNKYVTNYKYTLVPKKQLKEAEFSVDQYVSDLNIPNPELVNWIRERLKAFDTLEQQLNTLVPLIQQAKQDTIKTYSQKPNFSVIYGTDMAQDYLNDLIDLFKKQ
jgi:hypothetical protein